MNLNKILATARTMGIKGLYLAKKHKPEILMIASGISGLACVFFTRKAALKEGKILENHKECREKVEKIITTEQFYVDNPKKARRLVTNVYAKTGWELCKAYGPAVAFGLSAGVMGAMGFLVEKKRTENMKAALATALAAQKKFMEGKDTPELPSADNTDSSKEGESSGSKEPKKLPFDQERTFELMFSAGSAKWQDGYSRGPAMNGVQLKQAELYHGLILDIGKTVLLNEIANYFYPSKPDEELFHNGEKVPKNVNCPAQWEWEEGNYWGLRPNPDGNNQPDFGIRGLTDETLAELCKGRDGGIMLKIKCVCLDPIGYASYLERKHKTEGEKIVEVLENA